MVALKESHLAELGWHEESQPALSSESLNDKKGPAWSCECENLIPTLRKLFAFSFTNNAHARASTFIHVFHQNVHSQSVDYGRGRRGFSESEQHPMLPVQPRISEGSTED